MVIEAKLFSTLIILLDQYKRTQSLPWPLDGVPHILQQLRERLCLLSRRQSRQAVIPTDDSPEGSNYSLELTHQRNGDVCFLCGLCSRAVKQYLADVLVSLEVMEQCWCKDGM